MKKILIFLSMALIAMASCTKKDLLEVAYINALEGTTFTPAEVSALGDELTFSFNTNYQWQIRGYSTLGFCSVDLLKGDAGDATIKVKVAPNSTDAVRTAEFDILAGAAVQTVTITQTETNAIDIGTTSYTAPAGGGYIEIAVSANIDYTVNIPSEITWIRNAASTKAMESSFVMLEVDPNPLWVARSAEGITVTGKDIEGNDIVVPITVGQEAGGGVTTIWTKTFSADWNSVGTASPFHIAMRDGKLLMTDGKDIWAVDPVSGEFLYLFGKGLDLLFPAKDILGALHLGHIHDIHGDILSQDLVSLLLSVAGGLPHIHVCDPEEGTGLPKPCSHGSLDQGAGICRKDRLSIRHPELGAAAEAGHDPICCNDHLIGHIDTEGTEDLPALFLFLNELRRTDPVDLGDHHIPEIHGLRPVLLGQEHISHCRRKYLTQQVMVFQIHSKIIPHFSVI